MKKCKYCGKELSSNFEFCSDECEKSYRNAAEKDKYKIKYFILGIILGFLAMFYGVISNSDLIIGSGIKICRKNIGYITYSSWNRVYLIIYSC